MCAITCSIFKHGTWEELPQGVMVPMVIAYQIFPFNNNTILRTNDALYQSSFTSILTPGYDHLHISRGIKNVFHFKILINKNLTKRDYIVSSKNLPILNQLLSCFPTHLRPNSDQNFCSRISANMSEPMQCITSLLNKLEY